jgi:hypothetical protein
MCNKLHESSTPIPTTGKGWKIFVKRDGESRVMTNSMSYSFDQDGWVQWNEQLFFSLDGRYESPNSTYGFCFFISLKEGLRVLEEWAKKVGPSYLPTDNMFSLIPIDYELGLGSHNEDNFLSNTIIEIALCKKFKPDMSNPKKIHTILLTSRRKAV